MFWSSTCSRVHNFRRLEVWHEAIDLAAKIYHITRDLPDSERFGLNTQLRRAAVSVSSNIAEGAGRGSTKELARFLRVARGSLAEIDSQLELSFRVGIIKEQSALAADIQRLQGRIGALHDRISDPNAQSEYRVPST